MTSNGATSPSTGCSSIHSPRFVPPNLPHGELLDYVEGQRDLEAGIVRAIGSPGERFAEDKLRMLRAVRFAARFGFRIEAATAEAIPGLASQHPPGIQRAGSR